MMMMDTTDSNSNSMSNVAMTATPIMSATVNCDAYTVMNMEQENNNNNNNIDTMVQQYKEHRKSKKKKRDKDKDKDKDRSHRHHREHRHHRHRDRDRDKDKDKEREREYHLQLPNQVQLLHQSTSASSSPSSASSMSATASSSPSSCTNGSIGVVAAATAIPYPHNLKIRFLLSGAKTELSPPTHQNTSSESNIPNATIQIANSSCSSSSSGGVGATSSTLATTTAKALATTTATAVGTTSIIAASATAAAATITAASTTTTTISATARGSPTCLSNNSNLNTFGNKSHIGSPKASSTPASVSAREERYAAASQAIAMANSSGNNVIQPVPQLSGASMLGNANNTTPSLCVSVPLSAANVPGINLPANTLTNTAEQRGNSLISSPAHAHGAPNLVTSAAGEVSSNSAIAYERQSPHQQQHQQQQAHSTESNGNMVYASSQSVIHQSGKSMSSSTGIQSSQSVLTAGGNLTATATTTDVGIKISFEKQTTRVLQLQGQDVAPIRRSR